MAKKLAVIISYLCLFSVLAIAGANEDPSAVPFTIEIRQYFTMAIVAVVCIVGGVVLFIKTGQSKTTHP